MSWFYTVTVQPLVFLFRCVYMFCVSATGSYGLGLIALSLCCAAVYVPLNKKAVEAQENERHLQDVLKPQLERIKAESTGVVAYDRIAKLYRRYSYHPIMALRTGFSVLLQFPFLLAAYSMVSGLSLLQGKSFWFIADLSRPDGFWNGINLLPLVMTAINALSTMAAPYMRVRERLQAVAIALLFLWLLYSAPSALLFYWCCNNIIYLLQSLWFRFRPAGSAPLFGFNQQVPLDLSPVAKKTVKFVFATIFALIVYKGVICIIGWFNALSLVSTCGRIDVYAAIYRLISLTVLLPALRSFRRLLLSNTRSFTVSECIIKGALLSAGSALLFVFLEFYLISGLHLSFHEAGIVGYFYGLALYVLVSCFFSLPYHRVDSTLQSAIGSCAGPLYWSCALTVTGIAFAFNPADLFLSAPDEFSASLPHILITIFPYAAWTLAFFALIWFVSQKAKALVSIVIFFLSLILLLNVFVFSGDYGSIDVVVLSFPGRLYEVGVLLRDLGGIIVAAGMVALLFLSKHGARIAAKTFTLIACASFVFTGYAVVKTFKPGNDQTEAVNQIEEESKKLLPSYHRQLWGFNRNGANVLVFIFDMFTGGHMQEILARAPQLSNQLDGFVWYPDTTAVAGNTWMSTPSLLGGPGFTPEACNKNIGVSLAAKVHDAYAVLPNAFSSLGYGIAEIGTPYVEEKLLRTRLLSRNALLLPENWGREYEQYWFSWANRFGGKHLIVENGIEKYILALSVFKMVPHSFRAALYDEGNWHGIAVANARVKLAQVIPQLAPLQFMSTFSNAEAAVSTYKMIHTNLSHYDWHLKPDSLIPVPDPYPQTLGQWKFVDGVIPEHLYTEQHMMVFVAQLCRWMKQNGVYDNTRIIIASDHCDGDSRMLNGALDGKGLCDATRESSNLYAARPHALLLFKDFHASGPLQVRDRLMSTEDVPSLAVMDLVCVPGLYDRDALKIMTAPRSGRVRQHFTGPFEPHKHNTDTYVCDGLYTVTGTMFQLKNWSDNLLKK